MVSTVCYILQLVNDIYKSCNFATSNLISEVRIFFINIHVCIMWCFALVSLLAITVNRTVLVMWDVRFLGECHYFVFFTNITISFTLHHDKFDQYLGNLCPCYSFWAIDLGFLKLLNFGSAIPHLLVCFCPWTFFNNSGLNMLPLFIHMYLHIFNILQ